MNYETPEVYRKRNVMDVLNQNMESATSAEIWVSKLHAFSFGVIFL